MSLLDEIESEISRWALNGSEYPSDLAAEIALIVEAAGPEEIEEAAQSVRRSRGATTIVYSVPVELFRELSRGTKD